MKTWIVGASELDNVAYSIYYDFSRNIKKQHSDTLILNPYLFIHFKHLQSKYYNEAKIQLRRLKMEKLKKC
jgi:hypothetical protein